MDNTRISTPHSSTSSGRVTLADVTNLSVPEVTRNRARERYASLSTDDKEANLQKDRDYKHSKKDNSTSLTGTLANITNLSAIELRRKRDREVYASLSADEK